jgi:hypothetical protein
MTIQQKISIPLADLSESIGDGLALAFRRMRASDDFDEFLSALRSDGTDIEELNDLCENALLHEESLSNEDRLKIIAAHRAFNSVLRLEGRGSRVRLSPLLDEADIECADEVANPPSDTDPANETSGLTASNESTDRDFKTSELYYRTVDGPDLWTDFCGRAINPHGVNFQVRWNAGGNWPSRLTGSD